MTRNRRYEDRMEARAFLILKFAPIALALGAWVICAIEFMR